MGDDKDIPQSWCEFLVNAIHEGDVELVRGAIAQGADSNATDSGFQPRSALYWAASVGNVEIAKVLLDAGAILRVELNGESTALHAAVEDGNLPMVELLIGYANRDIIEYFDYVCRTPLIIAAKAGYVEIADLLLKAGADVNAWDVQRIGRTALRTAIGRHESSPAMVELLLKQGADVHNGGGTSSPLDIAHRQKRGNGPMIRQLIDEAAQSPSE